MNRMLFAFCLLLLVDSDLAKPVITPNVNSTTIAEGETLNISCSYTSTADFKWTHGSNSTVVNSSLLFINSTTRQNAGVYYCIATDNIGSHTSDPIEVIVTYMDAPTFNTSSQSNVSVAEGRFFAIKCKADSNPPIWRYTIITPTMPYRTDTIVHHSIQSEHAGTYTCVAQLQNAYERRSSIVVYVEYIAKPVIIPNINSTSIAEGGTLNISCSSTSYPAAEYKWIDASNSTVSNSSLLFINSTNRQNSGAYSCIATNKHGSSSSDAVQVDITYTDAPTFNTSSQSNVSVAEGRFFAIKCKADSNPPIWRYTIITPTMPYRTDTIVHHSIQSEHAGTYTCVAQLQNAYERRSSIVVYVEYIAKPVIIPNINSTSIAEGGTLNISCSSTSYPAAEYKWIDASNSTVSNSSLLFINSTNRQNSGAYSCIATNKHGSSSSDAVQVDITYTDAPTFNTSSQSNVSVAEGRFFAIKCKADSNPPIWRYTIITPTMPYRTDTIVHHSIQSEHAGTYTCVAQLQNAYERRSSIVVYVEYIAKPVIIPNINSTSIAEGGTLNISCSSTSYPAAEYKWIDASNSTVSNSSLLFINSTNRQNSGAYSCIATNKHGSSSSDAVQVDITYIDAPTFNTSSQNSVWVAEGRFFAIKCSANSNPPVWRYTIITPFQPMRTDTIVFQSMQRHNAAAYTCVAQLQSSLEKRSSLMINVAYLDQPTFNTSSATKASVLEGGYFSVACNATTNVRTDFRWTTSSGQIISSTQTLVFQGIQRREAGQYICIANNSAGLETRSTFMMDVQYLDRPTFNTSSQKIISIVEGRYLSVVCNATSNPNAEYKWINSSGGVISGTRALVVQAIQRWNAKTYTCTASNAAGLETRSSLVIDVQYLDRPTFNTSSQSNISIIEGRYLSVVCNTTSNPNAEYRWTSSFGQFMSASRTLVIPIIQRTDNNVYTCIANNTAGLDQRSNLHVIVHYLDAPVVVHKPYYTNGTEGSVNCSANGYPAPSIVWLRYQRPKANRGMLHFKNVLTSDAGVYQCRAENVVGIKQTNVSVNVTYKPLIHFTISANSTYIPINTMITLVCNVASEPMSYVTLKHDRSPFYRNLGSFSHNLTLKHSSTGEYACAAQNFEGSKEVTIFITVQEPPNEPRGFEFNISSRWISVKWRKPIFDGNSPVIDYRLQVKHKGVAAYTKENLTILMENVTNLEPYKEYNFTVTARNKMGLGRPLTTLSQTDSEAPPLPNKTVTSTILGQDSVTLRFRKFPNTFGIVTFYRVILVKSHASVQSPDSYTGLGGFSSPNTPYITAEFAASYFGNADEIDFAVGDKALTSRNITKRRVRRAVPRGYYNQPLEENTQYQAFLRAFVDESKFSSTNWFSFKTAEKPSTGLSSGAIAGICFGFILFILLAAIIIYYLKRCNEEDKNYVISNGDKDRPFESSFVEARNSSTKEGDFSSTKEAKSTSTKDTRFNPTPVVTFSSTKNSRFSSTKTVPADPIELNSKVTFEKHVNDLKANSNYGFSQEYGKFEKKLKHPYTHSLNSVNSLKNRYANIHPYDHSRVTLERDGNPGSDYINANYVGGLKGEKEYIAAQGPLPETMSDFWRMVWEQKCSAIVMLTNCIENGRRKCAQYWPTRGSLAFNDITVTLKELQEFSDHVVRTFHIGKVGETPELTVKQFQYISWPDNGVPSDPMALFPIIKNVNRWRAVNESTTPLVVHCSGGIGRTGIYIVLDTQMNRLDTGYDISIYRNVLSLRDARCLMVQTVDQYIYLHFALLEFINVGDTEVKAQELSNYIRRKREIDLDTGHTGIMDEFIALARIDSQFTFHEASKADNQPKNRDMNVYPYDATRVKLSQIDGAPNSDYINASHVNGYGDASSFIATQAPLSSTFADFWRMIWETGSRTIVMLSKEQEGGKVKMDCYWPKEGSMRIGNWIIEVLSTEVHDNYTLREMKLTGAEEDQSLILRHYQYTTWPDNAPPESASGIIDLVGQVSKWSKSTGNKIITVHCSAGVGRTGVFIALTNLIERLKAKSMVDVYQTVKRLHEQRVSLVQTMKQYAFCYEALQEYLQSLD